MQDAHTSTKCTGSSNTTREKQYNDESSCEKEVSLHIETTQQQMRSQEKQHNNDFSRKREIAQCLLFSWPTQLPLHCTHTHTVSVCVSCFIIPKSVTWKKKTWFRFLSHASDLPPTVTSLLGTTEGMTMRSERKEKSVDRRWWVTIS